MWLRSGREPVRAEVVRLATRAYLTKRRRGDPKYALEARIRGGVHQSLKKRGAYKEGRLWEILGYSCEALEKRLRKTLPKGFTWDDFMAGRLHIDHELPLDAFNYSHESHQDFKRAWALSNLQLLPGSVNMSKGAKLAKPFQPSLAL